MASVLALDVSSIATGWAFGVVGGKPATGEHRFAPKGASDDDILLAGLKWITQELREVEPDVVAIEAPILASRFDDETGKPQTNPHTQMLLWGLQAVIRTAVLAKTGKAARLVNVASARKLFTGRGTYPKGEAKDVVRRKAIEIDWLVPELATEGRADACCIWAKACADIDPAVATQLAPLFSEHAKPADVEL